MTRIHKFRQSLLRLYARDLLAGDEFHARDTLRYLGDLSDDDLVYLAGVGL